MAQIQFLNGLRDGEVQDLVEEASLSFGAAEGQFIQVKDQGVEPEHALIYSVKGQFYVMVQPSAPSAKVFLNFKPIGATAAAVSDKDILMFGRTLAKFWLKQAPAVGGAPTMQPAAAPDPRVARERDEAKARVADLEKQLAAATGGAGAAQAALDAARRETDARKRELEAANKAKEALDKELTALKKDKKDADATVQTLEAKVRSLDATAQSLERDVTAVKNDAEEAKKRGDELSTELLNEKKRASDLETELDATKPKLEQKDQELAAVRAAVAALEAADARAKRDRRAALRGGSDIARALEALGVPDALRDRLAAAVQDEVDRAVIGRQSGVVPLRGLRCPACDLDLEGELGKLQTRHRSAVALRALGLDGLSEDDWKVLVEKARAQVSS